MKITLACFIIPLFAVSATAQTTLYGDTPGGHMGERFDVLGDVNGDGVDDIVVGYPLDSSQGIDAGRVLVLSGIDGSALRNHYGHALGDQFGSQVAAAGFVDSDSVPDYMVAAVGYGTAKGAAYVFSGATGAQLHFMRGFNADDRLGTSISRAGDVNGDGHEDMLVGAPGFGSPNSVDWGEGAVYVVSGADGTPLHSIIGSLLGERGFGMYVSPLGDVNGDGLADFVASAPRLNNPGWSGSYVHVLSGADGSVIHQRTGGGDGHGSANHVGIGVSATGDLDGDGVSDWMFGEIVWWWPDDFHEGHAIHFVSGATGAVLPGHYIYYYQFPASHPVDPTNVGDVNGDGIPDMAYMTPEDDLVHVVSGASGNELQVYGPAVTGERFGTKIRGVTDVTGDGIRDIAIGVPDLDMGAGMDSGGIRFVSVDPCNGPMNYCDAVANSSGNTAAISSTGSNSVASNDFVLEAVGCPAGKPGLFFYGPTQVSTPYADGVLCVGSGTTGYFRVQPTVVTSAGGTASRAIDNTVGIYGSGPGQLAAGTTWNFQFWFRDPQGGPSGFTFSDGLEVTFCP
ncbi:MAG: hypothetical protein ACI9F9_000258 [Candidatus Paceibacteria bacterium]|jgi:hypothetical protein